MQSNMSSEKAATTTPEEPDWFKTDLIHAIIDDIDVQFVWSRYLVISMKEQTV